MVFGINRTKTQLGIVRDKAASLSSVSSKYLTYPCYTSLNSILISLLKTHNCPLDSTGTS